MKTTIFKGLKISDIGVEFNGSLLFTIGASNAFENCMLENSIMGLKNEIKKYPFIKKMINGLIDFKIETNSNGTIIDLYLHSMIDECKERRVYTFTKINEYQFLKM